MIDDIVKFIRTFAIHKIDTKYISYCKDMGQDARMTGAGVIHLLNKCVSLMPENTYYLEVGTWRGSTLCGAAMGNENKICVGIDNFTEFKDKNVNIKERLFYNINKWAPHAQFFEGFYQNIFCKIDFYFDMPVSIYWYDGSHNEEDHANGILNAKFLLADQAIILIDDVSLVDCGRLKKFRSYSVYQELIRFINENREFTLIRHFPEKGKNAFHQGIMALLFSRKEPSAE